MLLYTDGCSSLLENEEGLEEKKPGDGEGLGE
jgi:hypothetical protein